MSGSAGEIVAARVTEARTFLHRDGTVVLRVTAGHGDVDHYSFTADAFARFAKQLGIDAKLTGRQP